MKSGTLGTEYADKRSSNKAISFRYKLRAFYAAQMIKKYLSSDNLKILDFGCAEGKTLLYMDRMLENCSFTGLEYSADLLEMASEMPGNITLQQGDILNLPEKFSRQEYDVVTAMAFFEHLQDPSSALKKAHQALSEKGLLVVTFPNPTWDHIAEKTHLLKGGDHLTDLNKKSFIEMLSDNGFELLEYAKFMWVFVAVIPYLKISVHEKFAYMVDKCLSNIPVINMFMVNQLFVARKV
ncbi:MAG: class I SAM-dependent methyltransferase [Planctomycetes bacterium]|nr:class I SAM-dependent methyltransferase [Planctomycetota bacterium]